jgi:hypothetical protein
MHYILVTITITALIFVTVRCLRKLGTETKGCWLHTTVITRGWRSWYSDSVMGWTICVSIPSKNTNFFSSPKRSNRVPLATYSMRAGTTFPRKADHATIYSAEVKNKWNYTSTAPTCLHDVDRKNLTFYHDAHKKNFTFCHSYLWRQCVVVYSQIQMQERWTQWTAKASLGIPRVMRMAPTAVLGIPSNPSENGGWRMGRKLQTQLQHTVNTQ